jgi:hypothetical protein
MVFAVRPMKSAANILTHGNLRFSRSDCVKPLLGHYYSIYISLLCASFVQNERWPTETMLWCSAQVHQCMHVHRYLLVLDLLIFFLIRIPSIIFLSNCNRRDRAVRVCVNCFFLPPFSFVFQSSRRLELCKECSVGCLWMPLFHGYIWFFFAYIAAPAMS